MAICVTYLLLECELGNMECPFCKTELKKAENVSEDYWLQGHFVNECKIKPVMP